MTKSIVSKISFKVDCLDFFSFIFDKEAIKSEAIKEGTELHNLYSNYKKVGLYTSHKSNNSCATVLKDHFEKIPKIITIAKKINKNHPPSVFGNFILNSIGYSKSDGIPQEFIKNYNGKYAVKLEGCFDIKLNNIKTWNEFCTNGLFNIWNPAAPYNRLNSDKEPFRHQVNGFKYNIKTRKYDVNSEDKWRNINYQREGAKILLLRIYELNEEDFYGDGITINRSEFDSIKPKRVLLNNPVIDNSEFKFMYEEILDTLNQLKKTINYFDYYEDQNFKK